MIVFDSRGIGNTTAGSKPYSMQLLANDTAGLLDALNIDKADVFGYSLGGYIAQQFTVSYPEKVNRLILAATCCHRCTTCGVLYECEKYGCRMRFQFDRCSLCRLKSNF